MIFILFFVVCLLVLVEIKALQGFMLPACCEHLRLCPATLRQHHEQLGLHATELPASSTPSPHQNPRVH